MSAVIIEHVNIADLPETWPTLTHTSASYALSVSILTAYATKAESETSWLPPPVT